MALLQNCTSEPTIVPFDIISRFIIIQPFVTGQPLVSLVSIAPLLTLEKIKLELITEKFANKIVDKSLKQGITLNPIEVQINFQIY
jgi:hypothetical protein